MRLLIRFLIRTLIGFPVPRLLAAKDRQIVELQRETARLRQELHDLSAYNRKLVDSVLVRAGGLPTEQQATELRHSPPPKNDYDDDGWETEAHLAEIEKQAQMAAMDEQWYAIAKESAAVDPVWQQVLMRANEIKRGVS